MGHSVAAKRDVKRTYRTAQMIRRRLIQEGMEPWRVTATSNEGLPALVREHRGTQLRLVPNVDDADLDTVPKLGAHRLDPITRMRNEGHSEDEIASVLTFARQRLVEHGWPSADGFGPLDEFDPKDAA